MSWFRTLVGSVSSLIVWAAHFAIVYSLVGVGCDQDWHRESIAGINSLTLLLIALTLPALGLIAWIGWGGWRSHRQASGPDAQRGDTPRWNFLGLVTVALAAFAFVATLMTALPIIMLPPCN